MKGSTWWDRDVPDGTLGDDYTFAVLEAVRNGHAVFEFERVVDGDLEFEIFRAPLAIGEPDDRVFALGLSNEAVDMIAIELGKRGVEVMSPTPALYDIAAARTEQIGPHTIPTLIKGATNGAVGMTKRTAKLHSDAIIADRSCPRAFIFDACKTYVLHPYLADPSDFIRDGYGCEYGWGLPGKVGWGSLNFSGTGYVVQPAQWAHLYRAFRDYSMGAVLVRIAAKLGGKAIDLRDCRRAGPVAARVAPAGPVPFIIHPECREPLARALGPVTEPSAPIDRPTIRRGSTGDAVKAWQRILMSAGFDLAPWNDDGAFGKLTHNATVGFQTERGLPGTGIVDGRTWSAAGTKPIRRDDPADDVTAIIRSANFRIANRAVVDNIVIHTIEAVEASTTGDRTAWWFAGKFTTPPMASTHYCFDDDSTILCVPEEHVAFAAPGLNHNGIQFEHAGFARQTVEQWFDPFSRRMLARSAKRAARTCERWNIPPVYVDAARWVGDERGITTHYQVTLGPGKGRTTHHDPGKGFPMSTYIDMVRQEMRS